MRLNFTLSSSIWVTKQSCPVIKRYVWSNPGTNRCYPFVQPQMWQYPGAWFSSVISTTTVSDFRVSIFELHWVVKLNRILCSSFSVTHFGLVYAPTILMSFQDRVSHTSSMNIVSHVIMPLFVFLWSQSVTLNHNIWDGFIFDVILRRINSLLVFIWKLV